MSRFVADLSLFPGRGRGALQLRSGRATASVDRGDGASAKGQCDVFLKNITDRCDRLLNQTSHALDLATTHVQPIHYKGSHP